MGTASHWSASRDLLKVEMTEKMQRLRRICSSSTQFCHRDTGLKNPIRMEEAATKLAAFTSDTGMKTRAGNSSLGRGYVIVDLSTCHAFKHGNGK